MLATTDLHSVAEWLRATDPDLVVGDLYADGAHVYHDLVRLDQSEIGDLIRRARSSSTPVLELACGSGRLALPLLAAGRSVIAVDNEPRMLDLLRAEVSALPDRFHDRIEPVLADMANLDLGRQCDLVYCGITSITVLPDDARQAMFRSARDHVTATGRFAFSIVEISPTVRETAALVPASDGQNLYSALERVDHQSARRTVAVLVQPLRGNERRQLFTTEVRLLKTDDLIDECQRAGLDLVDIAVDDSPIDRKFITLTFGRADR